MHTEQWKKNKSKQMLGNNFAKGNPPSKGSFKKGDNLGNKNPNWKGGKFTTKDGYVAIKTATHLLGANNYTLEHRLVIEKVIGRKIKHPEVVHHINGVKNDNRVNNLILFKSNKSHQKFEWIQQGMNEGEIIFDGRNNIGGNDVKSDKS